MLEGKPPGVTGGQGVGPKEVFEFITQTIAIGIGGPVTRRCIGATEKDPLKVGVSRRVRSEAMTGDRHAADIDRSSGGDEQRLHIFAAKGAIRGNLGNRDSAE